MGISKKVHKLKLYTLLVITINWFAAVISGQNFEHNVDVILDAHIDAMGGTDLWKNMRTYTLFQTRPNGVVVTNHNRKPDEYKIVSWRDGRQRIKSYDGKQGFLSIDGNYIEMRPGEEIEMEEEPEFYEELLFARNYPYTVTRLKDERIDEKSCAVLQVVKSVVDTQMYWIDLKTSLIYMTGEYSEDPAHAGVYYKTKFYDFKKVDGYPFPFRISLIASDGRQFEMTYDSIKVNEEYPVNFFEFHPRTTMGYYAYLKDQFRDQRLDGFTFYQETVRFDEEGNIQDTSYWHEAVRYPHQFRIDFGSAKDKNRNLWCADSLYVLRKGEIVHAAGEYQASLLFKNGFHHYDEAEIKWRLDSLGINTEIFRTGKYLNRPVYIIGANEGDLTSPQVWYDAQHHAVVRRISRTKSGKSLDVRYAGHESYGPYWIEGEVYFYINGNLRQSEYYHNIQAPRLLEHKYFNPRKFDKNTWYE